MSWKKRRRVAQAVGLLLLVVIGWYLAQNRDTLASLASVSFLDVCALAGLALLSGSANALQFRHATRAVGLRLGFAEWYGLTVVNTMLNYFVPLKGALVMRATYMKQRYGLSFASYASLSAVSQVVTIGMAGLMAGLTILMSSRLGDQIGLLLLATLAVVASAGVYVAVVVLEIRPRQKLGEWFDRFAEGFSYWRQNGLASVSFLVTAGLWLLLQGVRLWLAFVVLGTQVPLSTVLVIQALASMSMVVAITPGNLGVKESVTALLASLSGVDPTVALLASLLDRAVGIAVAIPLGLLFSRVIYKGHSDSTRGEGANSG